MAKYKISFPNLNFFAHIYDETAMNLEGTPAKNGANELQ